VRAREKTEAEARAAADTARATVTPHAFRQAENLSSSSPAVTCVEFVSRQHLPRLMARQVGTSASNLYFTVMFRTEFCSSPTSMNEYVHGMLWGLTPGL